MFALGLSARVPCGVPQPRVPLATLALPWARFLLGFQPGHVHALGSCEGIPCSTQGVAHFVRFALGKVPFGLSARVRVICVKLFMLSVSSLSLNC